MTISNIVKYLHSKCSSYDDIKHCKICTLQLPVIRLNHLPLMVCISWWMQFLQNTSIMYRSVRLHTLKPEIHTFNETPVYLIFLNRQLLFKYSGNSRGFSAYFGKRSLVILGIFIDLNAQFGNFCIDKMVHFRKILCSLVLLNEFFYIKIK